MDAVVITYLTDGFPHVSYFTDLSFYFTPHAGLGYDMNNIRIKLLKLFVTHAILLVCAPDCYPEVVDKVKQDR